MEQSSLSMMWVICEKSAADAKEVKGYPSGREYIVRREFPQDVVQMCKKASWNLLYASDGMDAELPPRFLCGDRSRGTEGASC